MSMSGIIDLGHMTVGVLGFITLSSPVWLLLAVPLAVAWWAWPLPTRLLRIMRAVALGLVLLAMAGLAVVLPSRAGTVVVLADRSLSMPADAEARAAEVIRTLAQEQSGDHKLAVVGFGTSPAIERRPDEAPFAGFTTAVAADASDYARALEQALALIPTDAPGRILLLGDGRWTGRDPAAAAARAAARSVPVDYRLLQRPTTGDVAVERIDAPQQVQPGEGYLLTAWVRSPVPQEVSYELVRGNVVLARGLRQLRSGLNRLVFRDRADSPTVRNYRLRIGGETEDAVPENNTARLLVEVAGDKPLLHVTDHADAALGELLRGGRLPVRTVTADQPVWSLEELAGYSAVLLENVPADTLGATGMENLVAWVRQTGAGLLMTGGKQSFGPGGYYKSPLEPIMPVSMELRREHRKLALAIVVALDRSGSMTMPVAGGRTKMDLANLAAAEVVDLLSPMDEFGAWAVDSAAHKIIDRQNVTDKGALKSKLLSIDSQGGGIFVYEALSHATAMLSDSSLGTRHLILFADAQDSEQPGAYRDLLEKTAEAGITVSVIGLGKPSDVDAPLLRDIAQRGGGRAFFTEQAEQLPRLFAQDTFVVARSTFIEELTPVRATGAMVSLLGQRLSIDAPVGGYNLTYLRDRANLLAVTGDEYQAPLIAGWQVGAGRTAVYTGEADGQFTGPIAEWDRVGELFTSLARWVAGQQQDLPGDALLTQATEGGVNVVRLHLDPAREADPFRRLPTVRVLRGQPGAPPRSETLTMRWAGPDTLEADVPLRGRETVIATAEVADAAVSLPPVPLAYSPEYRPADAQRGAVTLEQLARATGGQSRDVLPTIWDDLPRRPRRVSLVPWLLLVAVLLLLTEVFERRSGMLTAARRRELRQRRAAAEREADAEPAAAPEPAATPGMAARLQRWLPGRKPRQPAAPAPGESTRAAEAADTIHPQGDADATAKPAEPGKPQPEMRDALRAARQRAGRRTRRDQSS